MIGVLTGDIINSKANDPKIWIKTLKTILKKYGKEKLNWELFRGDSFQIESPLETALELAIAVKMAIKQHANLDVRIAIGIGDKSFKAKYITESNGTAFVNSGECFDGLKKTTLAIKSPNEDFDFTMNTIIKLALLTMDGWTVTMSKIMEESFSNPTLNQKEIAKLMGKSQSNISAGLKRGGFDEVKQMLAFYNYKLLIW